MSCSWRFQVFFSQLKGKWNPFSSQKQHITWLFLLYILQVNIESIILKDLYEIYIRTKPHIKLMKKSFIYSGFILILLHYYSFWLYFGKGPLKMSHWWTLVIWFLAEYNFLIIPMEKTGKHLPGSFGSLEFETGFSEKLHFMRLYNSVFSSESWDALARL